MQATAIPRRLGRRMDRMNRGRFVFVALSLFALAVAVPAAAAGAPAAAPPVADATETAPLLPAEGPLFTPAPKPAAPECHFCGSTMSTSPGGGAPSHWGHGADCTAAQNDVRAQLSAFVDSQCAGLGDYGRCAFAVVFTCTCYYQEGQWVVDAYATYRCWINYCF